MKNKEENIVFENYPYYVYKMGKGHYEIRANKSTHSIVIGEINNPDEDEDSKGRAIDLCKDGAGVEKMIEKYS